MKLYSPLFLLILMVTSNISSAVTIVSSEEANNLLIYPSRSAPATVVALNHSVIPAQTSGVITKLLVNVGDKVLKGEILATLDCTINLLTQQSQSAIYEQLYSQLLFNKRELVRGRSLLQQKNIGEAELDRLNNAVENTRGLLQAQKATVESARVNVERCHIKAPYNGVVTKRIANQGEMIDFGKPLIELIESDALEVSAKIASSDEASFTQAKIFNLDIDGRLYKLTLRSYLPLIEANTTSREARFLFIDEQPLAGNIGRLVWQSPFQYLPAYLLQKRNGQQGYFIVENNKAKFISVELAEEGRPILFNLPTSTQVITEGYRGLKNGEDLQIKKKTSNLSQQLESTALHGADT